MAKLKLQVAHNVCLARGGSNHRAGDTFETENDDETAQCLKHGYALEVKKSPKKTTRKKATANAPCVTAERPSSKADSRHRTVWKTETKGAVMAIRTKKIDPERLYRVVEPFSFTTDDGVPVTLNTETVLLGRHEYVQKYPHFFGIEGDPADQSATRATLIDPDAQRAVHRSGQQSNVRILETEMRATRSVKLDVDGELRKVRKGELLDPSELICSLVPSAFERVSAEHKR